MSRLSCLYLVTSLLAWFPTGAKAVVLCLEPSGRIIVEHGGTCCATSAMSSMCEVGSQEPDGTPDDCGPCVDIRLGGPTGRAATDRTVVAPPLAASTTSVSLSHLLTTLGTPPLLGGGPALELRSTNPASRTVLLRN